jgi:hypothetical protein
VFPVKRINRLSSLPEREINPEMTVEILEKMLAVTASANVDKSKNSLYEITGLFFQALPVI